MIAQGVVDVLREAKRDGRRYPAFVVRLRGTGEVEAKKIVGAVNNTAKPES
jgi:succinyl-CoA synthetase beta subunit